jgi:hypothetical protein
VGSYSLVYPAAWTQVNWNCWNGPPGLWLFTTARPTPTCGNQLPPPERLGRNGVAIWFAVAAPLSGHLVSNPNEYGLANATKAPGTERVTCTSGSGRARPLGARLERTGSFDLIVSAVICGPDYGKSRAAIQRMLAGARFVP